MAGSRMRRINEVLREVVGRGDFRRFERSSYRLRDRDLRRDQPRPAHRQGVRQRARRRGGAGGDAEGLRSSHGVIQSRIAAETRMKRTPTLTFHYDDTIEQGVRISHCSRTSCWRTEDEDERGARRRHLRPRARRRRAARPRPLPADRPRGPRRRRPRLAARHAPSAHPARQGLGDVHGGEGVPAADRVPLPAAGGGLPRAAGRHGRPHRRSSSTAATSTGCRSTG